MVSPSRALGVAGWLLGAGLRVPLIWLTVGLGAQVAAIAARGYWPLLRPVLGSWRTVVLVALALAILVQRWASDPGASGHRWRRGAQWLFAVLVVIIWVRNHGYRAQPNSLGLLASVPNATLWTDQGHPHRPPALVRTNRYGFRDRDVATAPQPGTYRVIVVGDSYVYGKGVPEESGLIHNQLAAALAAVAPAARFEVLNTAHVGWGYFTYFDAARRLLRELRPRVIVIGSLGGSDWDLFDHQQQWELFGPRWFARLAAFGAVDQLKEASTRFGVKGRLPAAAYEALPGAACLRRLVLDLLADAERAGCDVVLWDYYEPLPFFDEFTRSPRFHRAGWPPHIDRRWQGWGTDARLAIPVDRHPTAAGNALVARYLAPAILEVLGLPGAAASGPASAPASAPAPTPPPATAPGRRGAP